MTAAPLDRAFPELAPHVYELEVRRRELYRAWADAGPVHRPAVDAALKAITACQQAISDASGMFPSAFCEARRRARAAEAGS